MTNEIRDIVENTLRAKFYNKKWLAGKAGLAPSTITAMLKRNGSSDFNSWSKVLAVLDLKLTVIEDG